MKRILIKPVITEKSLLLATRGSYTFIVDRKAQKQAITNAINKHFKVHVTTIRTIIKQSESIKTGKRRLMSAGPIVKKAIVTLLKNEKIDLFTVEQHTHTKT